MLSNNIVFPQSLNGKQCLKSANGAKDPVLLATAMHEALVR